jgi:hypothetical protein
MPPNGPRYFSAGAKCVSMHESVPRPESAGMPAATIEYSRHPDACQTLSPWWNPSARDSTTSPTVMMPSSGAFKGNELK